MDLGSASGIQHKLQFHQYTRLFCAALSLASASQLQEMLFFVMV